MSDLDFILAWDWEYDIDFINRFEELCRKEEISTIFVGLHNLSAIREAIENRKLRFKILLDRASDTEACFDSIIDRIILSGAKTINEAGHAVRAMDKASMHLEFFSNGIDIPYTIIISAQDSEELLEKMDVKKLGKPFVVKPSRGGGGVGVIKDARTIGDIIKAKNSFADEKYLLQEKIYPDTLDGKRAYFRVFYACGTIIPCWWSDETHVFGQIISKEEEIQYDLLKIKDIVKTIAKICNLDFFSTEIAKTKKGRLVVIDYVNDPCDMRLKSACLDGVPEKVVDKIIKAIIRYIKKTQWEEINPRKIESLKRRRNFELSLLKRFR